MRKTMKSPIFGLLDSIPDKPKRKKLQVKKDFLPRKINPDFKYNTKATSGEENFEGFVNKVDIPIELLKNISDKSNSRSKKLADIMLRSSIPSIMALNSAVDYTTSVLVDGFDLNPESISTNPDLANNLNFIGSLEIIYQFLRSSRLPKSVKSLYLKTITEEIAKGSANQILRSDIKRAINDLVKNGVVVSRSKKETDSKASVGKKTRRQS